MSHPHLDQPGLVRVTIEGADEQAVLAVAYALSNSHGMSGPTEPKPVPGEACVATWMYARADSASPGPG